MQRWNGRVNPMSRSELFKSHKEDSNSGQNPQESVSNSGPLSPGRRNHDPSMLSSGLVRTQGNRRRQHSQIFCGSQHSEIMDKQETDKDGHRYKERTNHFSGPLLATSNNIEQVLKEHDLRIQLAARRIRPEKKTRVGVGSTTPIPPTRLPSASARTRTLSNP